MVDIEGLVGVQGLARNHLFPGRILDAVNADDAVANLDSGLGCGRILHHPSNDRRLVQHRGIFVMHHVNAGKQAHGEQNVHGRTGDGDQEAVPARMRHEFARIAAALIHRVFAAHLDVTAQRQYVDAVVGVALPETEQAFAEADGKLLHPNTQQFGHGVVAELVNQDHESQNHADGEHRN